MADGTTPRVAIVHDWLTGMRGGEKVLALLCRLMPDADLFTLVHVPGACTNEIEARPVRTSWLNDLPGVGRYYRRLLPAMPPAVERMDVSAYDLVISSSHCVAKGVGGRRPGQVHVCYCYTPMRYAWHAAAAYRRRPGPASVALTALGPFLRAWDRRSARRVDLFIAISQCVARRIHEAYGRPSVMLYPPADVRFFTPGNVPREEFFLIVSALAPYKRVDLAVEAFNRLRVPLKVIGHGPELRRLRRSAGANVEFLGRLSDEAVRDHYRRCRAVVFPQLEDFGLVPLEAMACGAPVIAYGAGGALETVLDAGDEPVERPTGLLFRPQTPEALARAVLEFDEHVDRFDPADLRRWAKEFAPEKFLDGFRRIVGGLLHRRGLREPWA
jgi:glycosyltransferase involved in cell wall biosynthesis